MENRILYLCPICNVPMFEKAGLKLFFKKWHGGKPLKIEIDRKDNEGVMRIKCLACKKGVHILASIHEIIRTEESITINKKTK